MAFEHLVLLKSIGGSKCSLYACLLTYFQKYPAIYYLPLSHLNRCILISQKYGVVLNKIREDVDRLILRSNGVDCFPSRVMIDELADVL